MSSEAQEARQHRHEADELPDGDVVGIVLRQHADITTPWSASSMLAGRVVSAAEQRIELGALFLSAFRSAS